MLRYRVRGGHALAGRVAVRGAKNAALPILAATTLAGRPCTVGDVPRLADVDVLAAILRRIGADVVETGRDSARLLTVDPAGINVPEVPPELMRRMRSSINLVAPLLARFGRVRVSYPGGCVIGPRPIDYHLNVLRTLGACVEEEPGGFLCVSASRLRGTEVYLDRPSVGATEQVLMAAALAEGTTVLHNAAKEPEIEDLQNFLNSIGARVSGAGADTLEVKGVTTLGGSEFRVIPDRIEAGSFLCAAAATGGRVTVAGAVARHLDALLAKLRAVGCSVTVTADEVTVACPDRVEPTDILTQPFPGFPTDLQNPFLAVLLRARGTSVVTEAIFANRFKVAAEFLRLGSRVALYGNTAVVRGVPRLTGAAIEASEDLRGAVALVLAGLAAEGETVIERADVIGRGHEDLAGRLRALGADVAVEDAMSAAS